MRYSLIKTATLLSLACSLLACGAGDSPASVESEPSFTIEINPARSWYRPGQSLTFRGMEAAAGVVDAGGSEVALIWTFEPAGAFAEAPPVEAASELTATLAMEGEVRVQGCLGQGDASECESVRLIVDEGAPMLVVDSPVAGAASSDPEGIAVSGQVMDSRMSRVFVNGSAVELDADGRFVTRLQSTFGVHHVEVVATDGLGLEARVERDALWAPSFDPGLDTDGEPLHRLDDAIGVSLDRRFFDDGSALERGAVPVVTRDVADILELVLYAAELDRYVPSPLLEEGGDLTVSLTDIRVESADIEVGLEDGAIVFFVGIDEVSATSSGRLALPGETIGLAGTLAIAASASARVEVAKESPDAPLEVRVPEVSVYIEDIGGRFDSPEAGALFRLAGGALRTRVETEIRDALSDELRAELAAIVRSTVRSLDRALADGSFSIDASPLPPVRLGYDARLRSVSVGYQSRLLAELYANSSVPGPTVVRATAGVPRVSRARLSEVFYPDASLQVGVRLAVFNGLLHGLWAVGGLSFDATPLIPEALGGLVDGVQVDGRIQPVITGEPAGEADLQLSLGQLEIQISSAGVTDVYAANLSAGITLRVGGNEVGAEVDAEPTLRVWPMELQSTRSLISADVLESLIREQMWPELRRAVSQSLSQRIPLPNLGELSDIAPSIAGTRFQFAPGERIEVRQGVIVVEGTLLGQVPES